MEASVCEREKAPAVGERLICEDHAATIRYVGEVPPTQGVWLGVEWDDAGRGKHSGVHEGVKYFTCEVEGSGSFVRPRKVNLGTTFIKAVEERYVGGGVAEGVELYVDVKPVVMVGWDKTTEAQSQLDRLSEVSVRGMLVSSAGPHGQIATTTPEITKLDFSSNCLLSSWETLSAITSQLPLLSSLDLSENTHMSIPTDSLPHRPSFAGLKSLYLNKMALTWDKLSAILRLVPSLEELHACENRIDAIRDEAFVAENLRLLNLEENFLSNWEDVRRLKVFPKLRMLILNDNKIHCVASTCADDLPALQCICLSGNAISDWTSINALSVLPSLIDLRFKGNPLSKDESVFTMRQLLISRLGNLKFLNNSVITQNERQLAELYYLKRYLTEFLSSSSSSSSSQFQQAHPRYSSLAAVHGLPTVTESAGMGIQSSNSAVSTLKEGLIRVKIKCPEDSSQKQLDKRLPLTMTVQKLKGLLQRLYKVNAMELRLSYLTEEVRHEIELDDNLRQLSFYSMLDGDTVLVRW